jgi:hypothetical protein
MARKWWILGASIVGACAVLLAVASSITTRSNCGGNSAALTNVRGFVRWASLVAEDRPDRSFSIRIALYEDRWRLERYADSHWISGARFLVTTEAWIADSEERPILVIVCDTPFTNVPRRWIGTSPATHAAGYSDGSSGLISPEQFASLDKTSFEYLEDVLAGK